jgi:putative ATPase
MLEAGEDARFIARRLVILASEDIGLADSNALFVANAAAHAVEYVGLPEARLNLAHAVLYLSLAPKSNSVIGSLGAATSAVRDRPAGAVPAHLRDASYRGAAALGHGVGYVYPHDEPGGWVAQQHLPSELDGAQFYEPGEHGAEPDLADAHRRREEKRS